jgi:serralysin
LAPLLTFALESFGATSLTQVINHFFLRSSLGAGPMLSLQGVGVRIGEFDAWKPIAAEKVGTEYKVAWRNGNANQFRVWNAALDGSYVSSATDIVTGSDNTLQSLERTFQQDLNGDGRIGLIATTLEAFGTTYLVKLGNQFFLHDAAGSGPLLKYQGAPVLDGQLDPWRPIAAEKTASGYQVVWKNAAANQYSVWNVANDGGFVGSATGILAGTNPDFQKLEPAFRQDLNGDGNIGLLPVTLEAFGATRLIALGNQFFLRNAAGSGPLLKYQGAAVVDGQLDPWKPVAAEKTATGYQVVWKNAGANQYSVWNVANDGGFVASATGILAGTDKALQGLEPTFQQDLNGDGRVGLPSKTIEAFGATRLVEVGNQFFLRDAAGNGPALTYQGIAVTEGRFGNWKPIAAERTTGGYQLVWKNGGADQYQLWNTNSSGGYTSTQPGVMAGADASLKSLETTFQQDLNGDGQVGPAARIESFGVTALAKDGNQFLLLDELTGNGPVLKDRDGQPIRDGTRGKWKPLGAEKYGDGHDYLVAWKNGTQDQYDVWLVDDNGQTIFSVADAIPGSDPTGNTPAVDSWEDDLHQDLNGDGVIGWSRTAQQLVGSEMAVVGLQTADMMDEPNASFAQVLSGMSTSLMLASDPLSNHALARVVGAFWHESQ